MMTVGRWAAPIGDRSGRGTLGDGGGVPHEPRAVELSWAMEGASSAGAVWVGLFVAGLAMVVGLVVYQYRLRHPRMPIKQVARTFPVVGTLFAMSASACAFGLMELALFAMVKGSSPIHTALLFRPELRAAILTGRPVRSAVRDAIHSGARSGGHGDPDGRLRLARGANHERGNGGAGGPCLHRPRGECLGVSASVSPWQGADCRQPFYLGRGRLQRPHLERWEHGEPAWTSPRLLDRIHERAGDKATPVSGKAKPVRTVEPT